MIARFGVEAWATCWREDWTEEEILGLIGEAYDLKDALDTERLLDALTDSADVRTGWKAKDESKARRAAEEAQETPFYYQRKREAVQDRINPGLSEWLKSPEGQAWKIEREREERDARTAADRAKRRAEGLAARGGHPVQKLDLPDPGDSQTSEPESDDRQT